MSTNALCTQWLELPNEVITVDNVRDILGAISSDPWVVAAAAEKTLDTVDVQRALLTLGLQKTVPALERTRNAMLTMAMPVDDDEERDALNKTEIELQHESLISHFAAHTTDELLCRLRAVLLQRLDRLETYVEISQQFQKGTENAPSKAEDDWDDPWEGSSDKSVQDQSAESDVTLLLSLSSFLQNSLIHTALFFASNIHLRALAILFQRHGQALSTHRLRILQSIPEHVHPSEFHALLPSIDPSTECEAVPPHIPWRDSLDWTETEECISAFREQESTKILHPALLVAHSVLEVSQWYRDRLSQIDHAGLVDIALALVQHGASQGVPDLDEIGEELGLLSRLVYDTPRPVDDTRNNDWTLSRWRSLDSLAVVRAYLEYSTPDTIADNIRRLAMPYLFVLESRAERAGKPDSDLVSRLFYEYILQAPLELAVAIFDASKPTLTLSERLIKKDEDMARLALACLYGSNNLTDWALMSQIFECLPDWNDVNKEGDEADTTLLSLGSFVKPSTTRPRCTPQELLLFFSPLSALDLSHVLDVLDVHLESGEILARWNVPAPLRWFLQSANNESDQRAWATRMSRRAGGGGDEPESEEEWLELLEDMLKLVGGGEGTLRGAFGLLSKEEVTRIFFSGLLSSGNFRVAQRILKKSHTSYLSDPQVIEEQVLASSREFYDNASSGNLHQGDMKLAYECLNVAPLSPAIQREREFIEATSRICSFNVASRGGIPVTPIEIRLVKDRLSLVARVLSSTEDAYKHSKVILDLVHKLGYQDDKTAEVKALAMLADAALQAEDFVRAAETVEHMVDTVRELGAASLGTVEIRTESEDEAKEVCWHSCFQLGRQTEFHDIDKKLSLLGHALQLCPPEHMLNVLSVWRKIEGESIPVRQEKLTAHKAQTLRKRRPPSSSTPSFRARLQDLQLGSTTGITAPDAATAAALASRTFKSVAANFPFSVRGKQPEDSGRLWDEGNVGEETQGPDVSAHAKQAFARGIGWLIGADEE
ncbi:Sec39-domain-containing protein [Ramaria rubella]|nr:Sec39-domain-containing protein [Ramaria rubella]